MTRDWVALRPDKNGTLRGYCRNIKKKVPRRKRDYLYCPREIREQFNFTDEHTLTYNFLDKDELIEEMRNDPAMRGKRIPTKKRKPTLIVIWHRDGCYYNSALLFECRLRGSRNI